MDKKSQAVTVADPKPYIEPYDLHACSLPPEDFVDLFEQITACQPEAIAVREFYKEMSYGELNRRADELARVLLAEGVTGEKIVGVALNRSTDAIVAILGIWKAGAAYLPCDLSLPFNRLSVVILDSGTNVIVTDGALKLPADCQISTIDIRQLSVSVKTTVTTEAPRRSPEQVAYVIYTSGSTGHPKGVMLSYEGLANLVRAQRVVFTNDECRHVLQFSAHSFDASIFDITMALGHGGVLHMAGKLEIPAGEQLFDVLENHEITLATIPPSIVATLPAGMLPNLKTLIVAGEACPPSLAALWAKRLRFVNAYGPTEATVWATFAQCHEESPVTIGEAIPGCETCVLDQHLQPLPLGYPGELCLSGKGLARGYIGSPAMTAQKFIPHPRSLLVGERLYRTGDMVTRRHDRSLEFLGRSDTQYKIRGYRIEVGDVEAALLAHPQVAQATVIVLDGVLVDSKAIVAFAVLKNRSSLTPPGLLDFVSDRLPGYMIPSRCVLLDNMPITRSGKVDRSALHGQAGALRTFRAGGTQKPEGIIEETLERMWAHLLKQNQVAPEEDFFQLGGQSLVAIQIISRIQKVFGVRLPLNAILEAPTVRALAKRVEAESCVLDATT